jgi:hypothetical protein
MSNLTILPIASCLLAKRTKMRIKSKYYDMIKIKRYLNTESNGVTYGTTSVCIALVFIEKQKPRFRRNMFIFVTF